MSQSLEASPFFPGPGSVTPYDAVDLARALGLPEWKGRPLSELPSRLRRIKRTVDVVGASVLLLIAAPIMISIALAVWVTSPGPVLFRQLRIGASPEWARGEKALPQTFTILKFRTMHNRYSGYAVTPRDHYDTRITPLGRFLRKTSLDELPQLWSVLRGDMSLIGPRPEMPFVVKSYTREDRARLLVAPGLTGLWQLYGSRERPIHHDLHFDRFYLQCWGFGLDAVILWRTFRFVLRGGNV